MQGVWLEVMNGFAQREREAQRNRRKNQGDLHRDTNDPERIIRQGISMDDGACVDTICTLLLNQICEEGLHPAAIGRVVLSDMQYTQRLLCGAMWIAMRNIGLPLFIAA